MRFSEIDKHVKIYLFVFVALLVLTFVTVALTYVEEVYHVPVVTAVILALIVATIKGSLVAYYFMHLYSEKPWIFFTLIITMLFFMVLLLVPIVTETGRLEHSYVP